MRRKITLLILVIVAGALAACNPVVEMDPIDTACEALNQVNDALSFTALVGPNTDILDIVQAQTQLINSWRTLVSQVEKLDPTLVPPSLVEANDAMNSVPVANTGTLEPVAAASVATQSEIAQGVVDEFTPVCAAQPAN